MYTPTATEAPLNQASIQAGTAAGICTTAMQQNAPARRASFPGSAAAYRQVDLKSQVLSASPHGLIGLLYADLRECLVRAAGAIRSADVGAKARWLGKSTRLIDEGLLAGLDMRAGGDLAVNLHRIYSYCLLRLTQAGAANDAAAIDEVLALLQPVMDSWNAIGGRTRV